MVINDPGELQWLKQHLQAITAERDRVLAENQRLVQQLRVNKGEPTHTQENRGNSEEKGER